MKRVPKAQSVARYVAGDGWLQLWIVLAGAVSGPVVVPIGLELADMTETIGSQLNSLKMALIGCGASLAAMGAYPFVVERVLKRFDIHQGVFRPSNTDRDDEDLEGDFF